MELRGYVRADGRVGFRNHLVLMPLVVCADQVAVRIAEEVRGAVALPHQHGCAQMGPDMEQTIRTLVGICNNPNVGAAILISLGCETLAIHGIPEAVAASGKPVETLVIQEMGGTLKTIQRGIETAKRMMHELEAIDRQEVGWNSLVLATECGGSDTTSGIASNPAVGVAADRVVGLGGSVVLSETTEMTGAEHLLARRATSPRVAERIFEIVKRYEDYGRQVGYDMREANPAPGNIAGGITTLEEKSLGCIRKAGTTPVVDVIEYAEPVRLRGLTIMDTPGHDIESVTGLLAGGAQVVVFTTGRGTPTGSPIAPVIKVCGNPHTYRKMEDNLDINAGTIIEGLETVEEVGERILAEVAEVASGKKTKAEWLGHKEFAIARIARSF